jgi:hypothetical protein
MKYSPDSKPQITKDQTEKIAKHFLGANLPPLVLIGVRGYYSKTMGATQGNDINLYDDAMLVFGLDTFKTFNANTDPSFVKKNGKSMAMLNTGVYTFHKGKHKGKYNALRAYPEGVVLNCTRDGKPATCSFINIHKGGVNPSSAGVTWSEGCQTVPAPQYDPFMEEVYEKMGKNNMTTVKYILLTVEEMNEILK